TPSSVERGSPCPSVLRPQGRRKGTHPEGDTGGEVLIHLSGARTSPSGRLAAGHVTYAAGAKADKGSYAETI
ncbi:MAG: hypothetical protein KAW02_06035, partial [candidate division Zixibacteria bacterium]|nr:hypothetical protein [candidate division Zixibacteria bacterium]